MSREHVDGARHSVNAAEQAAFIQRVLQQRFDLVAIIRPRVPSMSSSTVVDVGMRAQFSGLLFGRRIAQEGAAADLRVGQMLEQVGPA